MKILYIIDVPFIKNKGVFIKAINQIQIWRELGNEVLLYSLYHADFFNLEKEYFLFKRNKLKVYLNLNRSTKKLYFFLMENKIDIVYSRQLLFTKYLFKILKENNVIFEINSDAKIEYKKRSSLTYLYYSLTNGLINKKLKGVIYVSNELKEKFNINSHSTVIGNGLRIRNHEPNKNTSSRSVVFIGSKNHYWNGFDKIIKLARRLKNIKFNVIGIKGNSENNLIYHGKLDEKEAEKIILNSTIGISTLSLYKKGMIEASPLKSRLYLSLGVPIIYAYKDTDLDGNEIFAKQFPNDDSDINIEEFLNFFKKVELNKFKMYNEIILFSRKKLSNEVKEFKRIEFFKKCKD